MKFQDFLQDNLSYRYACRDFDPTKPLPQEHLHILAQSIQFAPSSMGLQPYRSIFVTDREKKTKIASFSHTQQPVIDCSCLLILMSQKPYTLNANTAKEHYQRHQNINHIAEKTQMVEDILQQRFHNESCLIEGYIREQVYLAMGDMVRVATLLKIDSLIIGGFDTQKLYKWLDCYPNTFTQFFQPCILIALGYGKGQPSPKQRLPLGDVTSIL
ncbi:hypothetical protein CCZ01_04925 [Helicobacter monodelphidis]|uniref:nitroreductase family protein n=1 Tax=Helicobacter sp. 15-1451 TaxID=2004995 RepID=UPI000DCD6685|nr:nitroreductase family protein [Helicobacter sp. 15-1451]RAX57793.1 hypothetical protein CCZ01_04925 [Helicobacter sp. 15-1451]